MSVELHIEIPPDPDDFEDDEGPVVGYFRNFGVRATSVEEAYELVSAEITAGKLGWPPIEAFAIDPARLDSIVLAKSGNWRQRGIWYRSGRAFFPAD